MEWIRSERAAEGVKLVTLNRPDKLNAFFGMMREELLEALEQAAGSESVRTIVITGEGRGFCAGGDVEYMKSLRERNDVNSFRRLLDAGAAIVTRIRSMSTPVIAAINGIAAGAGCSLALACDYRIASDRAKFSQSFVRIGVHPDWGGTWLLPRIIGRSRAIEMMMTGRIVTADEAERIGLVDRVVPAADLMDRAMELATEIAAGPPIPIRDIKRALSAAGHQSLAQQLQMETEHQIRAFQSKDAEEGMTAFFEKRTPSFRGN